MGVLSVLARRFRDGNEALGRLFVFCLALGAGAAVIVTGCGDDEEAEQPPSNEHFTFEENEPGTHIGAYVVVDVEGDEFYSNVVEVLLESSDEIDDFGDYYDDDELQEATSELVISDEDTEATSGIDAGYVTIDGLDETRIEVEPVDKQRSAVEPERVHEYFEASRQLMEDTRGEGDLTDMLLNSERVDGCEEGPVISRDGIEMESFEMGTFNGWSCWTTLNGSVTEANFTTDYNWTLIHAPEGNYFVMEEDRSIDWPITGLEHTGGIATEAGCLNMGKDVVPIEDHDEIEAMPEFTFQEKNFGPKIINPKMAGLGLSIVAAYEISYAPLFRWGYGLVPKGMTLSAGWSLGGSIGIPALDVAPYTIGFSMLESAGRVVGPIPVAAWHGRCMDDPYRSPKNPNEALAEKTGDAISDFGDFLDESVHSLTALVEETGAVAEHELAGSTAVSVLMGPYYQWLNDTTGVGTADNIPAATQADWYDEWFEAGPPEDCDDCSNMSINHLSEMSLDVMEAFEDDDDAAIAEKGYASVLQFVRSAPEFNTLGTMLEGGEAAVMASFNHILAERASISDDPTLAISPKTLEYRTRPEETVDLPVTASEIADLVDASEDEVQGAEVCMSWFMGSDVCGELDGEKMTYNYTPEDPEPRLFSFSVDLAGAEGFDEEEADEWTVQPARRLVRPIADEPALASMTAAHSVISGAPVTLNARLVDEQGRFVKAPATFQFYDGEDNLLAEVESDDGRATHQFIPEPLAPEIHDVGQSTIHYDENTSGIGYRIGGERMSQYVDIVVDGEVLSDDDLLIQYNHPEEIVLAPLENIDEPMFDDGQTFEVINPGDFAASHTAEFE